MSDLSRRDVLKRGAASLSALTVLPSLAHLIPDNPNAIDRDTESPIDSPAPSPTQSPSTRERTLLDFGWRFALGHASDPAKDFGYGRGQAFAKSGSFFTASRTNFDDSQWRALDLPHDWAVELPFSDVRALNGHGAKPLGRDYPDTSIGWYRRVFDIPATDVGRRISIEFDGVFRDSIIALNGHYVGRHLSGYSPFSFDVTDFLTYGGRNVLVVRADATEYEGWFYEGAGIYRHVWLTKTHAIHVPQWGTFVRSTVSAAAASLTITTEIKNDSAADASAQIVSTVLDATGRTVGTARSATTPLAAATTREIAQQISVARPALWSVETPTMYKLVTSVMVGTAEVDRYETPFGIRTIRVDADTGFFLNDKSVKVKGTCNHQDHAGVGSALPDRIQYFRIAKLKEMNSNAYRTSHNHPTPELLDACDTLGMLVMDETRTMDSTPEALADLEALVRRDRNHPSVIWWSIGNEEPEQGTERGARIATTMKALVRRLDPTRPVTEAMNNSWGRGLSAVVDVQGFNYGRAPAIDDFHTKFPKLPSIGSEVASTVSTRGIYADDRTLGYVNAYDRTAPAWGSTAEEWWSVYDTRAFLQGGFVWTGFDYRGEPTPYAWPCISSHFGLIDTCGFPKDLFYYYQAWWGSAPVLHLFPHWNWAGQEGKEIEIWCHSNLERVELFVNGQSAGVRDVARYKHVDWKVPYAPGVIEARGYRGGQVVLTEKRETTGPAAAVRLVPDRPRISSNGEDVSLVTVQVVDAQGRVVPTASNDIAFAVTGPGNIIGVGNGDPSSHEPDKASARKVFNGLCMVIVQGTKEAGPVRVDATSAGLTTGAAAIECTSATPRG
jgi:beta-galactosidase